MEIYISLDHNLIYRGYSPSFKPDILVWLEIAIKFKVNYQDFLLQILLEIL